jgi:hypothetical protein
MTTTTAETKAEKKEPRDGDRERILTAARAVDRALADLERLALAAASRHDHQVDMLKKEVERLQKENDELRARIIPTSNAMMWTGLPLAARPEAPAVDAAPIGPWVITRNDANGRRFWGRVDQSLVMGWTRIVEDAHRFDDGDDANGAKPRGSKVITLAEAQRLVENDARVSRAEAELFRVATSKGGPTDG